ncbi:MAG: ferrous iron transport protein B [Cyclobacteriaceae bacterium]|nr:ferrous iron transport protein B [Cyclobacteriaceae bacterium]
MSSFNLSSAHKNCETCPVHDKLNLQKLGINAQNSDFIVALAGNPNTGKSTIFNALTGLRQHTGNWTGKTVSRSEGSFVFHDHKYKVIDLPGTYSLISSSLEEEIARNFVLFGKPDVTVIVTDATRLERNLNLVLQMLEISSRAIVCVNLIDEAKKNGITIDARALSRDLGVPVVLTAARDETGMYDLLSAIEKIAVSEDPIKARTIFDLPADIAAPVHELEVHIKKELPNLPNSKWLAIRLLDNDVSLTEALQQGELTKMQPGEAGSSKGIKNRYTGKILEAADRLKARLPKDFHDKIVERTFIEAGKIAEKAVIKSGEKRKFNLDIFLDKIFISPLFGYPVMFLLFAFMFWLTIAGANVPSAFLYDILVGTVHPFLKTGADQLQIPWWLSGFFIDGMYLATAWVISVMLPPMAIFFPMFTLLEDFGYLPRVAFNMDSLFKKAGAHGKQVMTMMMGFGCNAAGVVATRIIDSPRERLIAIITNNFAICNGRWPTQILIASLFIGALVPAHLAGFVSAMAVVGVALLGVLLTFIISWGLSNTVLKGQASVFSLELPPYRVPKFWQTLYKSIIDRTLFVLWRAVVFALPAGAVIWLISNIQIGGMPVAEHMVDFLDPVGWFLGLNGIILVAYIVAIPANEIVIPTVLMLIVLLTDAQNHTGNAGVIFETDSIESLGTLLRNGGFTLLTAINLMLFSLIHNPCSTTIYTIFKETKSVKWTMVSTFLPIALGILVTALIAMFWRM